MIGGAKTPVTRPVDLGLPSGTLWAPANISIVSRDGFTDAPLSLECAYFSWGNSLGHMPISPTSFDYDFGSSNDGPYNDTPGADIVYPNPWPIDLDPAQRYCRGRWFVPNREEFEELFNNCDFVDATGSVIPDTEPVKRITINGVRCIRLRSRINGKEILFPAAGNSNGTRRLNVNENGYAWYANLATQANGYAISFSPTSVMISRSVTRFYGYPIRPVWRPDAG